MNHIFESVAKGKGYKFLHQTELILVSFCQFASICQGTRKQGVEQFNFSGSGSIWVQQRFQISVQFRLRFR